MKVKNVLPDVSVEVAYRHLEDAVKNLLKVMKVNWCCPYNGFTYKGKIIRTPVNELRIPYLVLQRAKRKK